MRCCRETSLGIKAKRCTRAAPRELSTPTALVLGGELSRGVLLADLVVDEALLLQLLLVVYIAPVEDEGRAHGALEDVEAR